MTFEDLEDNMAIIVNIFMKWDLKSMLRILISPSRTVEYHSMMWFNAVHTKQCILMQRHQMTFTYSVYGVEAVIYLHIYVFIEVISDLSLVIYTW